MDERIEGVLLLLGTVVITYFFGILGLAAYFIFVIAYIRLGDRVKRIEQAQSSQQAADSIKIRCPNCKTLNDVTAEYCRECGTHIS
jgi:phage FluMu protein Com